MVDVYYFRNRVKETKAKIENEVSRHQSMLIRLDVELDERKSLLEEAEEVHKKGHTKKSKERTCPEKCMCLAARSGMHLKWYCRYWKEYLKEKIQIKKGTVGETKFVKIRIDKCKLRGVVRK